ncbi:unnamed protein product [Amoebophrya sp. A25]|nr:unnamed protein product [Amoebophrya sp. A25]|eukprot:GSA25T00025216001.1
MEVKRLADATDIDTVLESGFNQGQSTFFIRHAFGRSDIEKNVISMDPLRIVELDVANGNRVEDGEKLQALLIKRIEEMRESLHIDGATAAANPEQSEKEHQNDFCIKRCAKECNHVEQNYQKKAGIFPRIIYNADLTASTTFDVDVAKNDMIDARSAETDTESKTKTRDEENQNGSPNNMKRTSDVDPFWLQTFYPKINPKRTLVFLDDHVAPLARLASLRARGFRRFIVDDNYPVGLGWSLGERLLTPKQILEGKTEVAAGQKGPPDSNNTGVRGEEELHLASGSCRGEQSLSPEREWFEDNVLEYTVIPPVLNFQALFGEDEAKPGLMNWNYTKRFSSAEGVGSCFREYGEKMEPPALLTSEADDDMHTVDRVFMRRMHFNLLDVQDDPEKYLHYFGYCWMAYIELK